MQNNFCSLCFASCDNLSEAIEEDVRESLAQLLPHLDAKIRSDLQVLCKDCSTGLRGYFEFTSRFLQAHVCIESFNTEQSDDLLDLRQVFLQNEGNGSEVSIKDLVVCRFCLKQATDAYTPLVEDQKELTSVTIMMDKCFPGLELGIMSGFVICVLCHKMLEESYNFITSWEVEKPLKDDVTKEMEFKEGSQFETALLKAEEVKSENSGNLDVVKDEDDSFTSNGGDVDQAVDEKAMGDFEQVQELEKKDNMGIEAVHTNDGRKQNVYDGSEGDFKTIKEDVEVEEHTLYALELETNSCDVKVEQTATESIGDRMSAFQLELMERPVIIGNTCVIRKSSKQSVSKYHRSLIADNSASENPIYKCDICSYKTNRNYLKRRHILEHKKNIMYKCIYCSYQTGQRVALRCHYRTHRIRSEIRIYRCNVCPFKTRRKGNYKQHIIVHKSLKEVTVYKCESCTFETRNKRSIFCHKRAHMNTAQKPMYKCDVCSYATGRKDNFYQHMLVHKSSKEITMYQCESCTFVTRYKQNLTKHQLRHKNLLEMYKCETCPFKTRHKGHYKNHISLHKSLKEGTVYKCDSCTFETRNKRRIFSHKLTPKNSSQKPMYQCESCMFRTPRKWNLTRHQQTQEEFSAKPMYKYKTRVHKSPKIKTRKLPCTTARAVPVPDEVEEAWVL